MRPWVADQRTWLTVEYLPAYAPDLNPVEGLWTNLKGVELANRACGSVEELAAAAEQGIGRVRGEVEGRPFLRILSSYRGSTGSPPSGLR